MLFKVDAAKQTLFGYSLSGLLALRLLFPESEGFFHLHLSRPAIWYNDKEVLADEEAFSKRSRAGKLRA